MQGAPAKAHWPASSAQARAAVEPFFACGCFWCPAVASAGSAASKIDPRWALLPLARPEGRAGVTFAVARQATTGAGAAQLSVPSPTARLAFSTCTQSWAVMPATAPTKSVHADKKESAACTKPEVALSLVVKAR